MPPRVDLQDEATRVLQRLVRFETVNPPGNERTAQEWLAGYLRDAGLEVEMRGAEPERPNVVGRLRGEGGGPTLCLLSHMDTVYATPSEWRHDPWSGDVADGYVWGRGALDMKSQTAAEAVAAASLARAGWRPKGDLLVVCVVDEETGGALGAQWITQNHPDLVRCDYLLNEGAGSVMPYDGRRLYGVSCAEKGVFRFALTTRGVAGHASMPRMGDNALLKLGPILDRFGAVLPGVDLTDPPLAFLRAIGLDPEDADGAVAEVASHEPRLAAFLEANLRVTFTPTMATASEKINVIPSRAELRVDCRTPPGLAEADALRRLHEVIGDDGYEVDFVEHTVGNASPVSSPLMDAIEEWMAGEDPDGTVVPTMVPAFTDSRHFREAFPDVVAYGFFPQRYQSLFDTFPLIHSADERIDVRDLGLATRFFADVARRLLS
jgi:acetylornithine deacetylase/succinyl-diaminopimelate desuccinylase-like protein